MNRPKKNNTPNITTAKQPKKFKINSKLRALYYDSLVNATKMLFQTSSHSLASVRYKHLMR